MLGVSSGCGLCPSSCSGKVGAYGIPLRLILVKFGCTQGQKFTLHIAIIIAIYIYNISLQKLVGHINLT